MLLYKSFIPINKKTAFGLESIISPDLANIPSVVSPPIPLFLIIELFNLVLQSLPSAVMLLPKKIISPLFKGWELN